MAQVLFRRCRRRLVCYRIWKNIVSSGPGIGRLWVWVCVYWMTRTKHIATRRYTCTVEYIHIYFYTYICIYIYECIYIYIYIYIFVWVYECVCLCVCVYIYIYILYCWSHAVYLCVCVCVCLCLYLYVCARACVCVCTFVCVYMRLCVCVHVCAHMYVCVCVCVYVCVWKFGRFDTTWTVTQTTRQEAVTESTFSRLVQTIYIYVDVCVHPQRICIYLYMCDIYAYIHVRVKNWHSLDWGQLYKHMYVWTRSVIALISRM